MSERCNCAATATTVDGRLPPPCPVHSVAWFESGTPRGPELDEAMREAASDLACVPPCRAATHIGGTCNCGCAAKRKEGARVRELLLRAAQQAIDERKTKEQKPESMREAARVDAGGTAKPKTRLLTHARVSKDGTHCVVAGPADTYEGADGARVWLGDAPTSDLDAERIAVAIRAVYDADGGMVPAIEDMPRLVAVARQALTPERIDCPDLDALEAALAKAFRLPWTYDRWEIDCPQIGSGDGCEQEHDLTVVVSPDEYPDGQVVAQISVPGMQNFADANGALIVAAVNALPGLIAEVRRLRAHQVEPDPKDPDALQNALIELRGGQR